MQSDANPLALSFSAAWRARLPLRQKQNAFVLACRKLRDFLGIQPVLKASPHLLQPSQQ